ncbi:hypothetical protein I204_01927 [Kwoniella mangroviensis CBS 8886]|uniref:mitochondrial 54S ribosomal protein mL57 n=1 Tax=Kwoniella mangroviensis CBS 8507 TaxID=1296122 RepID=UPI00080D091F|nr:uncharacterized protein I203_03766 [Kwoniella mangroviensis CBS 8507]OCF67081.1 hypothetical protein I203_03766 [Kwoniella mangroviensis CBS 8507]OCF77924.1 hypothetical protein I204_01927 [Kwoniella mangroviensis CBS 8886]
MAFASSSTSTVMRSTRQLVTPVVSGRSISRGGRRTILQVTRPYSAAAALAESPSAYPQPLSSSSSSSSSQSLPPRSNYIRPSTTKFERKPHRSLTPIEAQSILTNLLSLPSDRQFSPELSLQILTHKSYRYSHAIRHTDSVSSSIGNEPHNSRLSFIGRRAFQTYLSMFIHDSFFASSQQTQFKLDASDFLKGKSLEDRLDGLRDTRNLGRLVAPSWGIGEVVRWDRNETSRESGDSKILGMTVESILGAIFNEYGSPAAQRAFHLHILPYFIPQLRDPRLIERVLDVKEQIEKVGKGILRV